MREGQWKISTSGEGDQCERGASGKTDQYDRGASVRKGAVGKRDHREKEPM